MACKTTQLASTGRGPEARPTKCGCNMKRTAHTSSPQHILPCSTCTHSLDSYPQGPAARLRHQNSAPAPTHFRLSAQIIFRHLSRPLPAPAGMAAGGRPPSEHACLPVGLSCCTSVTCAFCKGSAGQHFAAGATNYNVRFRVACHYSGYTTCTASISQNFLLSSCGKSCSTPCANWQLGNNADGSMCSMPSGAQQARTAAAAALMAPTALLNRPVAAHLGAHQHGPLIFEQFHAAFLLEGQCRTGAKQTHMFGRIINNTAVTDVNTPGARS
jgi:hypothetical protein